MQVELKNTLNLPETDFPMRASLVEREPKRIDFWKQKKLYKAIQAKNQSGKKFVLHDGPPFTNGDVHIGTALNKILKDCILRYKSMCGYQTPFHPGWDCHGLPIEHKVMQELNAKKEFMDPASIRKACEQFSSQYIQKQTQQFLRLGILADWENEYKTMDPVYEAEILRIFASFVRKGLVYRSKKPVYWSIACETALAEGEIEYKEHTSHSVWVKFKVHESFQEKLGVSKPVYCVIWTTTPWTLPANLAIAVHPELQYTILENSTEAYLVAEKRVSAFIEACKLEGLSSLRTISGDQLEGIQTQHPFIDRPSPVVLANYVTTDTGTGCVHTAPGHGLDDYGTGIKYNLEIYSPISDQGAYIDDGRIPNELIGATILEKKGTVSANLAVIELLKSQSALLAHEKYTHSYPHCWRSKTPVIFRATDQWFIALDKTDLRQEVIQSISKVEWIPEWGAKRIHGAVESRPDWCISRQRCWGTPLPVFYDEDKNVLLDPDVIEAIAQKIAQKGTQYWFEQDAATLLSGIDLPDSFKGKVLKKSLDTLDVWIDSGSSHAAVLSKNPLLSYPADLYLEGSDQHRGWFQSSLWTAIVSRGEPPYRKIITHGFVVDENKKKISKSDGKPQTADSYIKQFGADIIRLWICSEDYRNDIPISEGIVSHIVQTYRTIRNTLRFQLGNLSDFDYKNHAVAPTEWTYLEKWVMHEANQLVVAVTKAYENYEFHKAYQYINRFCSVTLSANYHDILKDRLYTYGPEWQERRSAQTAIYHIFELLTKLLAPILSFTTDEAWAYFIHKTDFCEDSIHLQSWPTVIEEWNNVDVYSEVESLLKFKNQVNEALEKARQNKLLGQSLDAKVSISIDDKDLLWNLFKKYSDNLTELFIVSEVTVEQSEKKQVVVTQAQGIRCPRSWRWVPELVDCPGFGKVSPRCKEALMSKYSQQ